MLFSGTLQDNIFVYTNNYYEYRSGSNQSEFTKKNPFNLLQNYFGSTISDNKSKRIDRTQKDV